MDDEIVFPGYYPKFVLPVYTLIEPGKDNDKEVGKKYNILQEKDPGRKKKVHDAILVAKERMPFDEVPDVVLAFNTHTTSRSKARETILGNGSVSRFGSRDDSSDEVLVMTFIRPDKAQEFVTGGWEELKQE